MISRRNFLRLGGVAVFAGFASDLFAKTDLISSSNIVFTGEAFKPLINSRFYFQAENSGLSGSLKLVEVKDLASSVNEAQNVKLNSFSLLFENADDIELTQDVYRIAHSSIGEFSSLIVPVTNERKYYEVIFNCWKS